MSSWRITGLRRATCVHGALVLSRAALAVSFAAALACAAHGQERPAKRISHIVGVALEEYRKGVDGRGRIISQLEYEEAVTFLADGREAAQRLSGPRAALARALLDSLVLGVAVKAAPEALDEVQRRFNESLGADAALDLPTRRPDAAAGKLLFDARCAACHGAAGLGDGPAARGMEPPPPAIGSADAMRDATPALLYRIVSVGVAGTAMPGFGGELTPDQRWDILGYLTSLRHNSAALASGEGVFVQHCVACHGPAGLSDGPLARALSTLPSEIGSFAWQSDKSDAQLAAAIRGGVPGRAMPPARSLSDADLAHTVAYLRSLAMRDEGVGRVNGAVAMPGVQDRIAADPAAAQRNVRRLLDEALGAARAGRASDAGDRAFDAYLAFEPIETPARARSPGLVASVERHFAEFRGAIKANDLRAAERARNAIEAALPEVVGLMRAPEGWWGAFLQSLLIILREGLEAILVIGAIVAFLIKTGHRERLRSIWVGTVLALLASGATAAVFATALRALPASREIVEGITMLVAVAVLFSVSYWLISKVEAARWQQFIREKVNAALAHGGGKALALVAFLAVYREGAETALFYQALFREGSGQLIPIALGLVVGAAALAVIFVLFHRYGVRLPLRPFFAVTSALLYYLAFVFMGKGIRELQEGNVIPFTVVPGLPHIDAMGIYPTVETLGAQLLLVVLLLFALVKTFWPKRSLALPTVPSGEAVAGALAGTLERLERLESRLDRLEGELAAPEVTTYRSEG
ncbi:MAG: FTR1 family protein [Gemmatimonadaceae bacterium]